jgi:membrane protein DedA with SNARE-associated domain
MSAVITEFLRIYGAPALGLIVCTIALGAPLPGSLLIVTAGIFVRQGILPAWETLFFGIAGAWLGDLIGFSAGHAASSNISGRIARRPEWRRARLLFSKYGQWLILGVRTLITSVTLPFNMAIGASTIPYRRFAPYNLLGILTWFSVYGGLGYVFGERGERLAGLIGRWGILFFSATIVISVFFLVIRKHQRKRAL